MVQKTYGLHYAIHYDYALHNAMCNKNKLTFKNISSPLKYIPKKVI